MNKKIITVKDNAPRLDVYLSGEIEGLSRKKARELCEAEGVKVNDRVSRAGVTLKAGDIIEIAELSVGVEFISPKAAGHAPLQVLFENERMLVVEKPRGISSVRLTSADPVTLADLLAEYCPACVTASPDRREAGLIQRLDFHTSGLAIAAKDRECWEKLREDLMGEQIEKSYLALVEGVPKRNPLRVDVALRQSADGSRMEIAAPEDSPVFHARSEIELIKQLELSSGKFSIVRVRGRRMRRHQVRIHLAYCGCPLVGDEHYGSTTTLAPVFSESKRVPENGFLLHAERIEFRDPSTGAEQKITSESLYLNELLNQ